MYIRTYMYFDSNLIYVHVQEQRDIIDFKIWFIPTIIELERSVTNHKIQSKSIFHIKYSQSQSSTKMKYTHSANSRKLNNRNKFKQKNRYTTFGAIFLHTIECRYRTEHCSRRKHNLFT